MTHKLVILIENREDWQSFEAEWPKFLHLAESMPGVQKEAISRVENALYGQSYMKMYELYFDSREIAEQALSSSQGQQAGKLLQTVTKGGVSLFIAEHKEDNMANIKRYKKGA